MEPKRLSRVLAVTPVNVGMGWVVFEGPFVAHAHGFERARAEKNSRCLEKVAALIEDHMPETLVLEAFEPRYANRSPRVADLCRALIALATSRGLETRVYAFADVKACFQNVGARTRHQIAEAIARTYTGFEGMVPKKPRVWDGQDYRMAVFSAAASIVTHYQFGVNRLFDDLVPEVPSPGDA